MMIEAPAEAVHAMLVAELKECLDDMMDSFNARTKGDIEFIVFDHDRDTDLAEIQKHIDALDLIIRYYDEVPS
jgi:hypothetical protein